MTGRQAIDSGNWPMTEHERASAFRERVSGTEVELGYAGIETFYKAPHRAVETLDDETDVAVLGVPYDGAASNRPGARYGPRAIRRASGWWAYLSGYKGGLTNVDTREQVDLSTAELVDCGDVPVFPTDRETTAESVTAHVATAAERAVPIVLGGDHYVTYPAFRGVAEALDADLGLVQIDAHTDTVAESAVFGEHFHGSSTNLIATSEYGSYENVAQVGIRGYESPDFFEFADDVGLAVHPMAEVAERGIRPVVEEAIETAADGTDGVYVTFDIDGVDPAVAPGTGTPCPGGLSAREALTAMDVLGRHDAVVAADLMEVAPRYDPTNGTERLASYLLVRFLEGLVGTA